MTGVVAPLSTPIATTTTEPPLPVWIRAILSLVIVVGLAAVVRILDTSMPTWFPSATWVRSIEFPIYAIAVGFLAGSVLAALGWRASVNQAFRTEFFIKTGLVLLGASINLAVIARAAGPAILQATILITSIFLITWFIAGRAGLDPKLRALIAASVSICGVSAAIAAAGAVEAKKEQLAYVTSLVILFALPAIFIQPWLATQLGLSPAVAGAWIGGNIDTTAAVTAAGSIVGDDALKVAAIVKQTQNAMMGIVAFLLTVYFVTRVERREGVTVSMSALWTRFPKFILGFVIASAATTLFINGAADPKIAEATARIAGTDLRVWFFTLAFVSIGLEFRLGAIREAGIRPIAVFGGATIANLFLALLFASLLFRDFTLV
ncbi:MAG TPA: putative sulfate exporter family transporter [Candidatus Deferrimicrobium sp.]|nr:putative sulfate exporter family transporter [Candidatus Deferrimicrobium sp.]